MVKWLPTAAGVFTSSALFYQFQNDIDSNTAKIRKQLYTTQDRLDAALPGNLRNFSGLSVSLPLKDRKTPNERPKLPFPSWSQTKNHIYNRFIPTFKSTWNEHVSSFAFTVNQFDAIKSIQEFVENQWNKRSDRK